MKLLILPGLCVLGAHGFVPVSRRKSTILGRQKMPSMAATDVEDAASAVPNMEAYSSGFSTVFEELSCKECTPSEGKLPDDLKGTYFRCGPAMFTAGSILPPKTSFVQPKGPPVPDGKDLDRMVKHPFEGDGAVLAVTIGATDNTVTSR